ncbi:unnamed protein product [Lactuca saligna]|uniref:Uncharacterized protein n=1 Tax=Lactuca saligna TaxID=75948 RepID=A0AA35YTK1_LACSI|nr:unnamed protein product [Lactuca saligna]
MPSATSRTYYTLSKVVIDVESFRTALHLPRPENYSKIPSEEKCKSIHERLGVDDEKDDDKEDTDDEEDAEDERMNLPPIKITQSLGERLTRVEKDVANMKHIITLGEDDDMVIDDTPPKSPSDNPPVPPPPSSNASPPSHPPPCTPSPPFGSPPQ